MPETDALITALRRSAQELLDKCSIRDRDVLVREVVEAAVRLIPAAVGGGITRTGKRDVRSSHATLDVIGDLDRLQAQLEEGPCIDAAANPPHDGVMVATDFEGVDGSRWPQFAPRAVEHGMRSLLSVSLTAPVNGVNSALNLYADHPDAFDDDDYHAAGLFAAQTGALLHGADAVANLGVALASRDEIGQAKGILMERFNVSSEDAFQMLVSSSQDTNIKLAAVARWVTHEREQSA